MKIVNENVVQNTGSPSTLCLGSGFRGHLVGIYQNYWCIIWYQINAKILKIRSLLVCLSVLVAFKITKVEISCIITCDWGTYCSNFIACQTCIRIYNAKKKITITRNIDSEISLTFSSTRQNKKKYKYNQANKDGNWSKLFMEKTLLMALFSKRYRLQFARPATWVVFFSCGTKPHHVEMAYETLSLKRVFSPHLNPEKHWYALNSTLCCSKQAAFCSTTSANLFPEEYKLVFLNDLRGEDGDQVSFRWFCSFRSSEKVYAASAFGLLLGILRLKSWSNCQFMKSDYIHWLISVLNARSLQFKVGDFRQNIALPFCRPRLQWWKPCTSPHQ